MIIYLVGSYLIAGDSYEVVQIIFSFTENAREFTWFGHMWSHQQPHLYENISLLEADMLLNRNFALVQNQHNWTYCLCISYATALNLLGAWNSYQLRVFCISTPFWCLSSSRTPIRNVEEVMGHSRHVSS